MPGMRGQLFRHFVSCTEENWIIWYDWMSCNRLKMNAEKTQMIWIGSRQPLAKVDIEEIQLLSANVHFLTTVHGVKLGVHFDSQLTICRISMTTDCRACFFFSWGCCGPSEAHWRHRHFLGGWLDYCNSLIIWCKRWISCDRLYSVQMRRQDWIIQCKKMADVMELILCVWLPSR